MRALRAAMNGPEPSGEARGDAPVNRHPADDMLAPVNERLRASGRPEVTSEQLGAVSRDTLRTAVREGRLDREQLTSSLAQNTGLSQDDARAIAGQHPGRCHACATRGRRTSERTSRKVGGSPRLIAR